MAKIFRYETEKDMCSAFMLIAQKYGWVCYPETCGFDIVLLDKETGVQIGIEAKQQFNAHVLSQCVSNEYSFYNSDGPDYRAVLVPDGGAKGLSDLARQLNITVIRAVGEPVKPEKNQTKISRNGSVYYTDAFTGMVPNITNNRKYMPWDYNRGAGWFDRWPNNRLNLPEYVPYVVAGDKAPIKLTHWKISAIKICILMERKGWLDKKDFNDLNISMSRWQQYWMVKGDVRGVWIKGEHFPDYRKEHPTNFKQIEADFDKWGVKMLDRMKARGSGTLI